VASDNAGCVYHNYSDSLMILLSNIVVRKYLNLVKFYVVLHRIVHFSCNKFAKKLIFGSVFNDYAVCFYANSITLLSGHVGWFVSVSNDRQTFSTAHLYLPYDDLCYHCTVSDDVSDVTATTDDVTLSTVVCKRTVCNPVFIFLIK